MSTMRQQIDQLMTENEALHNEVGSLNAQLHASNAHATVCANINEALREDLHELKASKKRPKSDGGILKKVGFLTAPAMAEQQASRRKREAEEKLAKEVKEREDRAFERAEKRRRTLLSADMAHVFEGTLASYKTWAKDQLEDLAASLDLEYKGMRKDHLWNYVSNHFKEHPELQSSPRYTRLFDKTRTRKSKTSQLPIASSPPQAPPSSGPPSPTADAE
ncbi:hypothetical protein BOTBODRAFT_359397 [Botryobasidium botryosum FD-172 SS1]|uniref:Uncharacterized protein n=1 Tax=Botryobasidium botryosum (strain FD-172 SS1) TaxID=930990 RepID=A0A067M0W8_BOTB1|nr:hypothetical protein BOTBODRAFT_359397 [Botryobasidium botryosum FD-172 SS1]